MQPWAAEVEVSPERAAALIGGQFPQLAHRPIRLLGEGWDNTAWLVDDRWLFRLPRRELGAVCMQAELDVLPGLMDRVPLPIPRLEFVGRPHDGYPWPFAGYALLPGRTACSFELTEPQRAAMAADLGRFLRTLHAIPLEDLTIGPGAYATMSSRADVAARRDRVAAALEELLRLDEIVDATPYREVIAAAADLERDPEPVVVHGDLYARHLLVDDRSRLSGVIDWGDVHRDDRSVDLAIAWTFLPASAHAAFREAYGPISESAWRVARFVALFQAAEITRYAVNVQDQGLLRAGRFALRNVLVE